MPKLLIEVVVEGHEQAKDRIAEVLRAPGGGNGNGSIASPVQAATQPIREFNQTAPDFVRAASSIGGAADNAVRSVKVLGESFKVSNDQLIPLEEELSRTGNFTRFRQQLAELDQANRHSKTKFTEQPGQSGIVQAAQKETDEIEKLTARRQSALEKNVSLAQRFALLFGVSSSLGRISGGAIAPFGPISGLIGIGASAIPVGLNTVPFVGGGLLALQAAEVAADRLRKRIADNKELSVGAIGLINQLTTVGQASASIGFGFIPLEQTARRLKDEGQASIESFLGVNRQLSSLGVNYGQVQKASENAFRIAKDRGVDVKTVLGEISDIAAIVPQSQRDTFLTTLLDSAASGTALLSKKADEEQTKIRARIREQEQLITSLRKRREEGGDPVEGRLARARGGALTPGGVDAIPQENDELREAENRLEALRSTVAEIEAVKAAARSSGNQIVAEAIGRDRSRRDSISLVIRQAQEEFNLSRIQEDSTESLRRNREEFEVRRFEFAASFVSAEQPQRRFELQDAAAGISHQNELGRIEREAGARKSAVERAKQIEKEKSEELAKLVETSRSVEIQKLVDLRNQLDKSTPEGLARDTELDQRIQALQSAKTDLDAAINNPATVNREQLVAARNTLVQLRQNIERQERESAAREGSDRQLADDKFAQARYVNNVAFVNQSGALAQVLLQRELAEQQARLTIRQSSVSRIAQIESNSLQLTESQRAQSRARVLRIDEANLREQIKLAQSQIVEAGQRKQQLIEIDPTIDTNPIDEFIRELRLKIDALQLEVPVSVKAREAIEREELIRRGGQTLQEQSDEKRNQRDLSRDALRQQRRNEADAREQTFRNQRGVVRDDERFNTDTGVLDRFRPLSAQDRIANAQEEALRRSGSFVGPVVPAGVNLTPGGVGGGGPPIESEASKLSSALDQLVQTILEKVGELQRANLAGAPQGGWSNSTAESVAGLV